MKPTQEQIAALVKRMKECLYGIKETDSLLIEAADMLEQLAADNARLRAALFECQEEIDDYIQFEYPHDHPVQERYRQRDYAANPARIALQEKDNE